jgi:excisionase family DNA binding protein
MNKVKLLNIYELSEQLGPPVRALRTWTHSRKIPFIKVGHRTMLFDPQKVRAALQKFEILPPATK